jgi:hypothetical protein
MHFTVNCSWFKKFLKNCAECAPPALSSTNRPHVFTTYFDRCRQQHRNANEWAKPADFLPPSEAVPVDAHFSPGSQVSGSGRKLDGEFLWNPPPEASPWTTNRFQYKNIWSAFVDKMTIHHLRARVFIHFFKSHLNFVLNPRKFKWNLLLSNEADRNYCTDRVRELE